MKETVIEYLKREKKYAESSLEKAMESINENGVYYSLEWGGIVNAGIYDGVVTKLGHLIDYAETKGVTEAMTMDNFEFRVEGLHDLVLSSSRSTNETREALMYVNVGVYKEMKAILDRAKQPAE